MSELEEGVAVGVGGGDEKLLQNLLQLTMRCGEQESSENRSNLDPMVFRDAGNILRKRVFNGDSQERQAMTIDEGAFPIITQTFRFLRNALAGCKRNQDLIREETDIISISNRVLELVTRFMEINGDGGGGSLLDLNLVAARCTLQFLMNFMVDNLENGHFILSSSSNTIPSISELLKRTRDETIIEYAAMNFHTLLKLIPDAESSLDCEIIPIMLAHTHLEFVMYLIETLCTMDQFMVQTVPGLNVELRVKLIRVIIAHSELHDKFSKRIVAFFSDRFKQKSDLIFKSQLADNDDWTVWEIATLLELLCCLSALDNEHQLKTDSSLLTTIIFLLKSVHSSSKPPQEGNDATPSSTTLDFSPVSDIEAMKVSSDTEEMRSRPSFQFKAHLIRLIANLIHRNFLHQETVRETGILPVILDSCRIDARNPFITQWAVLAVRNACEGNPANQELVRSVQQIDTRKTLADPKVQLIGL